MGTFSQFEIHNEKKRKLSLTAYFRGSGLSSYSTVGESFFLHMHLFISWWSCFLLNLCHPVDTAGCSQLFAVFLNDFHSQNVVEGLSSSQHCRVHTIIHRLLKWFSFTKWYETAHLVKSWFLLKDPTSRHHCRVRAFRSLVRKATCNF